jgi:hypothetical protein
MEAVVPDEIRWLRWRVWPGKEWGRARGLPTTGLWPQVGGGAPTAGRPAAHRERGHGEPCSGGLSVWEEARVAQGGCRGRVELRGGGGLRRNGRRSGTSVGRTGRAAGVCCGLRGAGRCATFIGRAQRRDARLQCRGTTAILTCVRKRLATDRWALSGGMARHALPHGGLAFPGDGREGEPAARASRRWGLTRTDAKAAERAARGAGTPGRLSALWQRTRARPIRFLAGQYYFDHT